MASHVPLGSTILDTGKKPEEWVAELAKRGYPVSERTLRKKAADTIQKGNDALESAVETETGWRPDTRALDGKDEGGDA